MVNRIATRKSSIGGFTFVLCGVAWHSENDKTSFIYSVSYLNLGDLEFWLGDEPTNPPRGDRTGDEASCIWSQGELKDEACCSP